MTNRSSSKQHGVHTANADRPKSANWKHNQKVRARARKAAWRKQEGLV